MKNKKGFTLIELLAVIVVLAIIALIATPLIISIIEKVEMEAFRDTGYGIVESGRLYRVNEMSNEVEKEFTFPDNYTELNFSGEVPTGGTVLLNSDSTIDLSIYNSKYCAVKSAADDIVNVGKVVKDDEGNVIDCDVVLVEDKCSNPEIIINPSVDGKALSKSVTISYKTSSSCNVKLYKVTYDGEEDSNEWLLYDEDIELGENAKVEAKLASSKNKSEDSDIVEENVTGINNKIPTVSISNEEVVCNGDGCDDVTDNKYPVITPSTTENVPLVEIDKGQCSVPSVSGIESGWKQSKSATISVDGSCDTLKYSINDDELSIYNGTITIDENAGISKNTAVKLNIEYSDSSGEKEATTVTIYIYQIDNISPYTPILSNYKTKATKLEDYGMQCSTSKTDSTTFERCAIWVNCKEGAEDENGDKLCTIYSNVTAMDNENGSGIKNRWYKYWFLDEDGNELDGSTDDWTLTWNSGGSTHKDKTIRRYKYEDYATNESSEMELTIYWNATEKGTLADTCQSDIWDGTVDTSWYNETDTEFTINTASELAGISKIVNDGIDDFSGKTINLGCSINLNDVSDYKTWGSDDFDDSNLNKWTPIGGQEYIEASISSEDEYNELTNEYGVLFKKESSNDTYYSPNSYYSSTTSSTTYYYLTSFKGDLNGNSYNINGLYIKSDKGYNGLIGYGKNIIIKNINLTNSYIFSNGTAGGLVALAYEDGSKKFELTNVNLNNLNTVVSTSNSILGGALGLIYFKNYSDKEANISNITLKNDDNILLNTLSYIIAGGIIGEIYDFGSSNFKLNINDNYNNSLINAEQSQGISGGIVGEIYISNKINAENTKINFYNNVNDGTITGMFTGGMVGYIWDSNIIIHNFSNLINNGNVTGEYAGGIIGYGYTNTNYDDKLIITSSENNGTIKGTRYIGGILGFLEGHFDLSLSNLNNNGAVISTQNSTGGMIGRIDYKSLYASNLINNGVISGVYYVGGLFGTVTRSISDSATLYFNNLKNNASLISNNCTYMGGIIGYLRGSSSVNVEMDKLVNNGNIKTSNETGTDGGGLVGYIYEFNNVVINNSYNRGNIEINESNSYDFIGGIIGFSGSNTQNSITNSYNVGNLSSDNALYIGEIGGIVGGSRQDKKIIIKNTYNAGNIVCGEYCGGIIGSSNNGVIENNYNFGNISSNYKYGRVGGILYSNSSSTITNNYNSGVVSNTENYISGGILGYESSSGTLTSNYYQENVASSCIAYYKEDSKPSNSGCSSTVHLPSVMEVINGDNAFMNDIYDVNNGYPVLNYEYEIDEYESNNEITSEKCFAFSNGVITGYNENCGLNVVIPTKINGVDVIEIGTEAFYNSNIESITFPLTLKKIGNNAFYGSNLTGTLKIPKNVTTINTNAFYGTKITGLDLSGADNLVTIKSGAFGGISTLTGTIVIPKSIVSFEYATFTGANFTGVDFSKAVSLKIISNAIFNGMTSLTGSVVIPANVVTISNNAFTNTSITSIDFSNASSLTTISNAAFAYCSNLTGTLVLPKNITEMTHYSFSQTSYSVIDFSNFENNFTLYMSDAFSDISTITTVILNDKITLSSANGINLSKIIAGRSHENIIDISNLNSTASVTEIEYNDGYCTNDNNSNFYEC